MFESYTSERPFVFLSYSRSDFDEVSRLRDDMISAGIEVWWDQDILGGQDWKHEIRKAMRRCNAVILCLSKKCLSQRKSGIYPEALDAISTYREYRPGEIFLIPVRFSECSIPCIEIDGTRTLDSIHHIDLFPREQWHDSMKKVIASIESISPKQLPPDNIELPQNTYCEFQNSIVDKKYIEIIIGKDFDSFTESDQELFLRGIGEFLKMEAKDIIIKKKQPGSVKLTLELPSEKAEKLFWAIKSGLFEKYGVLDAEFKEPQETTESAIPINVTTKDFESTPEETGQLYKSLRSMKESKKDEHTTSKRTHDRPLTTREIESVLEDDDVMAPVFGNKWTQERLEEEIKRYKQLENNIVEGSSLIADVFGLPSTPPALYCGGYHTQYRGEYISYEDLIVGWAFSLISTKKQAYLYGRPKSGSAIVSCGSPMANKSLCKAQGLDSSDPLRRRTRRSLTGETLRIEFAEFFDDSARANSYISGTHTEGEFRWGIIDDNDRLVARPDIYRPADTQDPRDVGFLKEDDLIITVLKRHDNAPIILVYGAHAVGSMAMTLVLSNRRLLKELQKYQSESTGFQAHVHIMLVIPDHERRLMTIPDPEQTLELVSVEPVQGTDERLLLCFNDPRPARLVNSNTLLVNSLCAAGADLKAVLQWHQC